jgi:outer membrane biosynthesis protein TonB
MVASGPRLRPTDLSTSPKPVHPALTSRAGIEGVVKLDVSISKEGTVESVEEFDSHPLLAPAAMEALKQ